MPMAPVEALRPEAHTVAPPRTPREPPAPQRVPLRRVPRLSPADRDVLALYLLTRVGVWVTAYCARWLFPATSATRDAGSVLAPFERWDWHHYLHIARDGYFPGHAGPWQSGWDNREAFFPGFPLLLRAVHTVVPHWTACGLLISFVAGGVAVLALARIARSYLPGTPADRRTVLFFLLSPCAVFLAAGYTEALFLAFALPAWLAAQRRDWPLAATLTALATTVRVSGLFLAAAVVLHFAVTARSRPQWRALPWLALPALPVAVHTCYLYERTGDWMAWNHAEQRGWDRTFHAPWEAWANTWRAAFGGSRPTGYAFMFQAELAAVVIGVLLVGFLLHRRRWPEAGYIGLSLWALGTSYWYMSVLRAGLLWWPLWIALAALSLSRPWLKTAYLCVAAPLSTVFALTFLSGRWAG
ncbi:mannosyltransferase family protein [Streptomyces sp. NPDC098789]|uniref:mannosyltransferase family protein n=1 Tax=Streptomyces sp. NPDC098789 TaxID=3366098 RepID=UPI00382BA526